MAVDSNRGVVYVPTASPNTSMVPTAKGQTYRATGLLAINARTGKLLWYYQMILTTSGTTTMLARPMLTTVQHEAR